MMARVESVRALWLFDELIMCFIPGGRSEERGERGGSFRRFLEVLLSMDREMQLEMENSMRGWRMPGWRMPGWWRMPEFPIVADEELQAIVAGDGLRLDPEKLKAIVALDRDRDRGRALRAGAELAERPATRSARAVDRRLVNLVCLRRKTAGDERLAEMLRETLGEGGLAPDYLAADPGAGLTGATRRPRSPVQKRRGRAARQRS